MGVSSLIIFFLCFIFIAEMGVSCIFFHISFGGPGVELSSISSSIITGSSLSSVSNGFVPLWKYCPWIVDPITVFMIKLDNMCVSFIFFVSPDHQNHITEFILYMNRQIY
ncbi:hypothetical protein ACJW30_10G175300 [Castanea mollissima]